tara:strand:+ start:299 stop:421 length:123 start_codon:yes stop_codon:yes gene_type:complete
MEGFFWLCMGFVVGCIVSEQVEKYKKNKENKINNLEVKLK